MRPDRLQRALLLRAPKPRTSNLVPLLAGMPVWMARLPVLGNVLRGISLRAVVRIMEDLDTALEKVTLTLNPKSSP